jgi:sulfur carrier protein ThiS
MMIEIQVPSLLHEKIAPSDKNLGRDNWEVPEETSVADVLEMLNLTNVAIITIRNGRQEKKGAILKEGDVLKIFSAVSGG